LRDLYGTVLQAKEFLVALSQRLRLMSMESVSGDEHTQKKNED
jgi:hypothetical protein